MIVTLAIKICDCQTFLEKSNETRAIRRRQAVVS